MKTTLRRLSALFLVFSIFCAVSAPVVAATSDDMASPRASYYISSTYASISNNSGTVTVSFDIIATGRMTSVGATVIRIKDANDTTVKTFYSSSTSGMMGYNCVSHVGSVTYNGISGKKYYAVVSFKAENSSGSDTDAFVTDYT